MEHEHHSNFQHHQLYKNSKLINADTLAIHTGHQTPDLVHNLTKMAFRV